MFNYKNKINKKRTCPTKSFRRGFTLIELLVVISIIGMLSSIVLASLNDARAKARDARRMSDIKQIQNALELYRADNGEYPTKTGWAMANSSDTSIKNRWESDNVFSLKTALVGGKYIAELPTDPKPTSGITSVASDVYGYSYFSAELRACPAGQWYGLVYRLEKDTKTQGLLMCNGTTWSYLGAKISGMGK